MEFNNKKSLWQKGKEDNKTFVQLKLKRMTNLKTMFFGLFMTALIIIPIAIVVFQFVELYWYYTPDTMFLFLGIAFALFMVANGLSNYITVKATKLYVKDMDNLQEIDEFAIFFYQFLNPWFALFTTMVLIFFGVSAL